MLFKRLTCLISIIETKEITDNLSQFKPIGLSVINLSKVVLHSSHLYDT